jgi:hypothetical protein
MLQEEEEEEKEGENKKAIQRKQLAHYMHFPSALRRPTKTELRFYLADDRLLGSTSVSFSLVGLYVLVFGEIGEEHFFSL